MYRNCVYNNKTKSVHLWTWDSQGNRIFQELDFKPYLQLEDKRGTDKSIYGTSLRKREFETLWDRNKFVKESGIKRIFENLPPYQQFLVDNYFLNNQDEDFSQFPLKVCYVDIENPLPDKFPDIETADAVINLITCFDSLTERYTTFGLKAYKPKNDNVDYHHCKSEHDLLKKFIGHISSDYPDVFCGWNSNGYDLKYLINRITFELGKEWADELSPIGRIYEKVNKHGKFGQATSEYVIEGISCLDYMVMYTKFKQDDKPENSKLDTVAELELNENKIEHEGSLWDLARDDWETYVDYNIKDVELVVKLDKKLDYISLIRFLAYNGLCGLEQAIKTVGVINGAIAVKARLRNQYIPSFTRPKREGKNAGGFVQESRLGFANNVVSFDANSLYPSVMISLNISPETKIGKISRVDNKINLEHVSGRTFEFTDAKFLEYIKEEKAAISSSGHLFSQRIKGIMPEFLDELYTKRKEMKNKGKMLKVKLEKNRNNLSDDEIEEMETQIQRCDTFQNAYKILLNSVYGYTGNQFAFMGDDDIANSVTLTGQSINKKNRKVFVYYLINTFNISEADAENCCIAGDTDSGYFSLEPLNNLGYKLKDENGITPEFLKVCEDIEKHINDEIYSWCLKVFKTTDCRIVYKREAISDHAIFLAKKHYVMHILDDEGMAVNKFKYKGVGVVTGKMPRVLKPYVKKVIEHMIMSQSMTQTNELYLEAYELFKGLETHNVATILGMNNYEVSAAKCSGIVTHKGMCWHIKAAYFHDHVIKELNLESKYQAFKSGEKVRIVHLKIPNRYNIKTIGFRDKYPKEFEDIFLIDHEKMFLKMFFSEIKGFYEVVNWKLRKPNESLRIELEDFFS